MCFDSKNNFIEKSTIKSSKQLNYGVTFRDQIMIEQGQEELAREALKELENLKKQSKKLSKGF